MALTRDPGIVLRTEILKIVGKNSLEAYGNVNKIITGSLCNKRLYRKKMDGIQVKSQSLSLLLQGRNRTSFCRWDYLAGLCVRRLQGTGQGQSGLGKTRCRKSVLGDDGLRNCDPWAFSCFPSALFTHQLLLCVSSLQT